MVVALFLGQLLVPSISYACGTNSGSAKSQILSGVGETGASCNSSNVTSLADKVINLLSVVAGIIAVIMILVSAIKFTTSGGDTQKVTSAKNSLIYAIVGIAIAGLAQVIVIFVLHQTSQV